MGIFGGGNKTSSKTDIQNTDNRVAASENAIVAAAGATINFQDPGIVGILSDLEKGAFKAVSEANNLSQNTVSDALDLAKSRSGTLSNQFTDLLGPGLMVIAVLGGFYIWKNV